MYSAEQQSFIDATGERILLEAVAGSGKTHAVAGRVAALEEAGKRVLVLAFSNSAVDTISARIQSGGYEARVETVVAYALEVLHNHYGDTFAYGSGEELMELVCSREPIRPKALIEVEALLSANAPLPRSVRAITIELFRKYQEEKARYEDKSGKRGYLSFVDVVEAAIGLPATPYDEVIVDEAQDLTPAQTAFVEALPATTLTLVGDSAQSIYTFSGVDAGMFEKFQNSGATRLTLTTSYRCPSVITAFLTEVRGAPMNSIREGGSITTIRGTSADLAGTVVEMLTPGDAVLGLTARQLARVANLAQKTRPELHLMKTYEDGADYSLEKREGSITFRTIHKAKGEEWNRVFLLDTHDDHTFWTPFDTEKEEQERLFYVGASRAEDALVICDTTTTTQKEEQE